MQQINLVLHLVEDMGGSWKYQQEKPSRGELDIFSNLYLDKQALGNSQAPSMLNLTVCPDGGSPSVSSTHTKSPGRDVDVIVRLYEKTAWTIHYQQEQPDPQEQRIITDPYVGIGAFDNHPPPDLLRITLHLD